MSKITTHKYIVRIDSGSTHCWQFRYADTTEWDSDLQSQSFTDRRYGSKDKAYKAAVNYRNEYLKQLGKLHLLGKKQAKLTGRYNGNKRQNTSGIIGVRFTDYINRNGHSIVSWDACGCIDYKHWHRSFSINKYGDKTAYLAACKARYDRQGALFLVGNVKDLPWPPGVPWTKQI